MKNEELENEAMGQFTMYNVQLADGKEMSLRGTKQSLEQNNRKTDKN